jgi:hypothetical protein
MTTISGVLSQTGQFLSLNVADFGSGTWMLKNVNPANIDANVYAAVGQMGTNMTMATAAFTVISKPAVESAGAMVSNLGEIVGKLPAVLTAMTAFFSTLVDFLKA